MKQRETMPRLAVRASWLAAPSNRCISKVEGKERTWHCRLDSSSTGGRVHPRTPRFRDKRGPPVRTRPLPGCKRSVLRVGRGEAERGQPAKGARPTFDTLCPVGAFSVDVEGTAAVAAVSVPCADCERWALGGKGSKLMTTRGETYSL